VLLGLVAIINFTPRSILGYQGSPKTMGFFQCGHEKTLVFGQGKHIDIPERYWLVVYLPL